jgi:hypothetical protein
MCGAALPRPARVFLNFGGTSLSNYRRSIVRIVALAFVLSSLGLAAFAASWPGLSAADTKNIMPVSEVKRGMRGYGLTVFSGTKIEKFDVEILGVLKRMNTGRDLIMVRVGGGPITSRNTGIIGGMSGSPIYIKGKLIGAISYGSSFAKEPVGMVTPIADMLEAWDPNLPKHATGYSSAQSLPEPMSVDGKSVNKIAIEPPGSASRDIDNGTIYMQPLMTTMMVSGMSQRGINRLADILKPFGIRPMAGPGSGSDPDSKIKASLQPGAAVGMSLASGDIDLTGIGTVTYNRDGKIVAFGHPMLGVGAVDAPMTTAYITDIISSYQVSTKLGSSIQTVGRIFQDRPWCIAGAIGAKPKTIPVTISVEDQAFKRDRVYHINVLNHPLLASRLIAMVTDEAIYDLHPTPGDATAEVTYNVMADQVGKITRSNVFFDPAAVDAPATMDIASLLQLLSSNKFHPLDIHSVNVRVRITDKRNTATIDRIFVKKSEFEPGETVDVGVVMRPYKAERVTKTFQVKIPATATDGRISLVVRGGGSPMGMMIATASQSMTADAPEGGDSPPGPAIMMGGDPSMSTADNVSQLVSKFLEREKNNDVVVQLLMRGTAMNIAGEKLTGMPSAIADVMKSSRNSGLKMEREEVKAVYPNDSIIYGSARLMIDVKKKSLREGKAAPKGGMSLDSPDSSSDALAALGGSDSMSMGSMDYGDGDMSTQSTAPRLDDIKSPPKTDPTKEDPMTVDKDSPDSPDDSADTTPSVDSKEPDKAPTPPVAPKSNIKTVVRQAQTWSQNTQADFAKGTFAGVSASSENKLELAPTLKKLAETPEQFVWCVTATKGGVYAGTGNSGKIYKISDTGEAKLFYETDELEVHSMVRDSAGNVYAGTAPHGKIFKISPDGTGKLLYTAPEKYVLALALDPEGNLYAGVGDAGKIYRIQPNGTGAPFASVNEQQVLSLSWDPHGSLLVGTGINGVVYRVTKTGSVKPIFDATEDSITSVVSDGDGNAYAGTSPKGVIYKISPNGQSKSIYSKANRVLSMACDSHNNVYAVSDSSLVKIAPDETVVGLDSSNDKVQFLSLAIDEEANTLYAGTGNIGSVYVSKCCDIRGTYESPVHDAKMISKWGRIKWVADAPEATGVEVRTRTGNVEAPDSTWTDWSAPYKKSSGEAVASAKGRYIQYQVALTTGKPDVTPRVAAVTVNYLTPNQAPTVKLSAPVGGEVWAGKQTIKWIGADPDKDTLSYDVFSSKDGGKTWKALVGGMSGGKTTTETKPASEITAKIDAELAKSKDIPEDMKAKLASNQKGDPKPGADVKPKPAGGSSTSTSYTWDTVSAEDGAYIVKVVGSDKNSNANDPLSDTIVSQPFTVCNKAPEVKLARKAVAMKGAAPATITGTATSKLVEIAGVQYRVDGGDWAAASPASGMFSSPSEDFTITTPSLTAGAHKVEVQAIDTAGNAASATVEVKVS